MTARLGLAPYRRVTRARNARHTWSERDGRILTIDDGDTWGQGEIAPLPGYSIDTLEDATRALRGIELAPLLELDDAPSILAAVAGLDIASPSARCGLETALLDRLGRRRGLPVHRLFGTLAARSVPLSALLPDDDWALERQIASGIRTFKMKIGRDVVGEATRLAAIRARHPDLELRLDANGALAADTLGTMLAPFVPLAPSFVEEPCPLAEHDVLPSCPIPVGIDESLARRDDVWLAEMLGSGRVAALVLKPMALGGLGVCLALAERAAQWGVGAAASHLFDGPLGLAIAAELALLLPIPLAAGVVPHDGVAPQDVPPSVGEAFVRPHAAPGFGLPRLSEAP